jgi:hypothetical protein
MSGILIRHSRESAAPGSRSGPAATFLALFELGAIPIKSREVFLDFVEARIDAQTLVVR